MGLICGKQYIAGGLKAREASPSHLGQFRRVLFSTSQTGSNQLNMNQTGSNQLNYESNWVKPAQHESNWVKPVQSVPVLCVVL